jgi:uncharacterized delta-60 repeat protein
MKHFSFKFFLALTLLITLTQVTHTASAQTPCSLDPTWDTDGKLVADGSRIADCMLVLPDGKLLVACNPFGDSYAYLKRYNTDGSVDASYGNSGQLTVQVAERRTDIDGMAYHNGVVYLVGSTTTNIGGTNTYVYAAATTENGAFVSTFGVAGVKKFNSGITDLYTASDIVVDANGGIFIAGLEWLDNLFVLKLTATGAMDVSWDNDGIAFVPTNNNNHWWDLYDMELDKYGQVLITGKKYRANNGSTIPNFWHVFVARWNANGTLDNTFATNGVGLYNSDPTHFDEAKSIMVTAANNYVTAGVSYMGSDYDYSATGILHDGTLNTNFGVNGWSINDLQFTHEEENCLSATMLPDGRILQTGNQGSGDTVHFALLMLNPDGSRDNVFSPDGLFMNIFNQNNNSSGQGMTVDPSGKIYMGGYTRTCANGTCGPLYMALSRYNNTFGNVTSAENPTESDLVFFPNPAKSDGFISLKGIDIASVISVELIDLNATQTRLRMISDQIQLPNLPHGVYFLQVTTETGQSVEKLRIE